jgi:hypothetical protein
MAAVTLGDFLSRAEGHMAAAETIPGVEPPITPGWHARCAG